MQSRPLVLRSAICERQVFPKIDVCTTRCTQIMHQAAFIDTAALARICEDMRVSHVDVGGWHSRDQRTRETHKHDLTLEV